MDFLRNIAKGVYKTLNPIVSKVSSSLSNINRQVSQGMAQNRTGNVASVFAATQPSITPSTATTPQPSTQQLISSAPVARTDLPAQRTDMPLQQTIAPTTTLPQMSVLPGGSSTFQGSVSPDFLYIGDVRPATPTIKGLNRTDEFGRMSTAEVGNPYYRETASGEFKLVTPKVAFSGMEGGGGSGFASLSAPASSGITSGASGVGGFGSSIGINSIGTSAIPTVGSEEERILNEQRSRRTRELIAGAPGGRTDMPVLAQLTPSMGITPGMGATQTPNLGVVPPSDQLSVNAPSGAIDMGRISDLQSAVQTLVNSPENLSTNDVQALNSNLASLFDIARQKIEEQSPTPPEAVVDTVEQSQFIESSADPFGARQLIDDWKRANTDLMTLQAQRVDILKNIQALNQAYTPIIDDIKKNPNLPKALAARRLESVQTRQKEVLQGFLSQYELLNQSIDDQNNLVNRAFNIAKMAQDQAESTRNNETAKLKLFIDSGAIGAFTDADIRNYAQRTGISANELRAIKNANKNPNQKTELIGSGTGGYFVVSYDTKTGNPLSRQMIVAPATTTGTGELNTRQTQNFINISTKYQSDPIIQNASRAIDAGRMADMVLKNPSGGGNQLSILYTLVKSLDPESAVREGEIDLAQQTQSYLSRFKTSIERISTGKIISDQAAIELANATKNLAQIWTSAGVRRDKQYESQANVSGIGQAWKEYIAGAKPAQQNTQTSQNTLTPEQAYAEYLRVVQGK